MVWEQWKKKSRKLTWKIAKMIPVMPTYNRLFSKKFSIDLKQPWNQKKSQMLRLLRFIKTSHSSSFWVQMWSIWTKRTKSLNTDLKGSSEVHKSLHFRKAYKFLLLKTTAKNTKLTSAKNLKLKMKWKYIKNSTQGKEMFEFPWNSTER